MRTTNHRRFAIAAGTLLVSAGLATSTLARQQDDQPPAGKKPQETYRPGRDTDRNYKPSRDARPIVLAPTDWVDDKPVRGLNDEKLGEVKDLIIARVPGRVTFVLVGHGGVLKIGEKVTAVPLGAMTWNSDKQTFTLPMTEDQLKAAPTLDSGEWKTLGDDARTEPIYSHFNTPRGQMDADEPRTPRPDEPPRLRNEEHPVLRVSDIRGKALIGSDGREVGKVNDLVLDTSSGRIAFVAVTFGGVLGIGEDKVAVPWTAFDVNKDGHLYVTTIDKDTIKAAPHLTQKDWGELREPGFAARVYQHYGRRAAWLEQGTSDGKNMAGGWSEYDRLYSSGTPRDVDGTITVVEEDEPMKGIPSKVTILTVNTKSSDTVRVHVCPKSYLDQNNIQLRKGDVVAIQGREAMVDGKPVVIVTRITPAGGRALVLHREDGTCTWQPR